MNIFQKIRLLIDMIVVYHKQLQKKEPGGWQIYYDTSISLLNPACIAACG
jgi:hypothetical protein